MPEKEKKEKHIVDEIYGEHAHVYRPHDRRVFIISLALAVLFGGMAGVVADFLSKTYLYDYFWGTDNFSYPYVYQGTATPRESFEKGQLISVQSVSSEDFNEIEKRVNQVTHEVRRAMVAVYEKKKVTGDLLLDAYKEEDRKGQGVVLTSDGWLATNREVVEGIKKGEPLVVAFDKQMYDVETFRVDAFSGVAFLKINANRLPVVPLGEQEVLRLGQMLLTLDPVFSLHVTHVKAMNFPEMNGENDIVQSTERLNRHLLVDDVFDRTFEGSPVFNLDGQLVGLLQSNGNEEFSRVLPVDSFRGVIADVFRGGEIVRPMLGIQYIDLGHVLYEQTVFDALGFEQNLRAGALIFDDTKRGISGVLPKSAAEEAGFLSGDIIIKVNDDALDATYGLTEFVNEYQPGDRLVFTFLRKNAELTTEVVLGTTDVEQEEESL